MLTFGQPKVTNEAGGAAHAADPLFRIINDQDLVAQAPPSDIVFDLAGAYEHFGPEISLRADGKWTYSATPIPREFLTHDNWKQVELENAIDHQIKNYISRMAAAK